jgi:hypothetical protein
VLVNEAIGVPLHDLRTLVADTLRRIDPARARDLIAAILEHASTVAGDEYRAGCEGDWATQQWQQVRARIAAGGLRG